MQLIKKFKEIWQYPRYRAIIILILYFIFFAVMFSLLKSSSIKDEVVKEPIIDYNKYQFNVILDEEKFSGSYYNGYMTFSYNNTYYTYEDNILIPSDFNYIDILKYVDLKIAQELISDRRAILETKLEGNSFSKTYQIDNDEVTIFEKDNRIYQINVNNYQINYTF